MAIEEKTSVVMVSYHTGGILWDSIKSVLSQPELGELVVVNNGNPSDFCERLETISRADSRIKIINPGRNLGFAAGCNLGAKEVKSKYLLLLNPDCVLPENALSRTVHALEDVKGAMVAGCCLVNPNGTEQVGARRNLLTPLAAFVEITRLYRLAPGLQRFNFHERITPTEVAEIPATSGAFMLIRTADYRNLGGMDEKYFLHVEDLDFCFRVNQAGGRIIYVPYIRVIHHQSTSEVPNSFIEWNKTKGFIYYFNKTLKNKLFVYLLAIGIFLRFCFRVTLNRITRLFSPSESGQRKDALRESLIKSYQTVTFPKWCELEKKDLSDLGPVLVTGASGQVGIAATRYLLKLGVPVIAQYHRHKIDFSHKNLTWLKSDMRENVFSLDGAFPKTVIHTPLLWYLPAHLESLAKAGVKRIICFSSTSIFGKATSSNEFEQDLVSRLKKAEGEIMENCNRLGIACTIFRPTLVYGNGLDRNITDVARFALRFGFFPISGKALGLRQPVHVDDLACAVLDIADKPETFGKAYNLCGGEVLTYRDMVARIFKANNIKQRVLSLAFLPELLDFYSFLTRKREINGEIARRMNMDLVFDDNPARRDFGYSPRKFL